MQLALAARGRHRRRSAGRRAPIPAAIFRCDIGIVRRVIEVKVTQTRERSPGHAS
jgi:hypothetical protein